MRICIPTESREGLAAAVAPHLGRAPYFTLVDTESGEIEVVANGPHGGHACSPAESVTGAGVDAVVCQGAGRRAVARFETAGIRVLVTSAARVDEAVAAARQESLQALGQKDACAGHHGTGEHRCRKDA